MLFKENVLSTSPYSSSESFPEFSSGAAGGGSLVFNREPNLDKDFELFLCNSNKHQVTHTAYTLANTIFLTLTRGSWSCGCCIATS